ncbi:MAG: chitinase [Mucilaginibacter sp.]|nr:chitinase [Mucilaginibacter sp.]
MKQKTRLLLAAVLIMFMPYAALKAQQKQVIIGYVGGYRGAVNTDLIAAKKLTHINYAFVDIRNNRAWLHKEATDTINFRNLSLLKKQNPALKILISIGGWAWSGKFSDAVLTDTARQGFARSAIDIVNKYGLDGVDIDWEYPARPGNDGNIYRPEDKHNYTLMFQEIRRQLDSLQKQTGKTYLLTTAVGGFKSFLDNTEMGIAQQYLNYINLMTYDFGNRVAGHHTNLYASKKYSSNENADNAVKAYLEAGVPANKLVMGIAFYGKTSILANGAKGLGDSVVSRSRGRGYTIIKDSLIKIPGYKAYRDRNAKAPYLYNAETREFITYDDEWSVKKKCQYVKSNDMGGVMFWEYNSDLKGYLLDEINRVLK